MNRQELCVKSVLSNLLSLNARKKGSSRRGYNFQPETELQFITIYWIVANNNHFEVE